MPATIPCHSCTLLSPLEPPTEAFKAARTCRATPLGAHQRSGQSGQAYLLGFVDIGSTLVSTAVGSWHYFASAFA